MDLLTKKMICEAIYSKILSVESYKFEMVDQIGEMLDEFEKAPIDAELKNWIAEIDKMVT